jgi:hypothetical protein
MESSKGRRIKFRSHREEMESVARNPVAQSLTEHILALSDDRREALWATLT